MASELIDRLRGLRSGVAVKAPVRAVAATPITLSGEQTVDGVALVTGDRVLVAGQVSSIDNGVYDVNTGAWVRAADFDKADDVVAGTMLLVTEGTSYGATMWRLDAAGAPGEASLTFSSGIWVADGSVGTNELAALCVTTAKLAAEAVTAAKLATDAVETAKIKDANVTAAKLADSAVTLAKTDASGLLPFVHLRDIKLDGTAGGTFTAGTVTRTLNQEVTDTHSVCTLSSNAIKLAVGTYEIYATAPAHEVGNHRLSLYDIFNGTTVLLGANCHAAVGVGTRAHLMGAFTVDAGQAFNGFYLNHTGQSTKTTTGLGAPNSFAGDPFVYSEVYAEVFLHKVK